MILEELFGDVATMRSYVPYLESNVSFSELESSARSAKKQVCVILTIEVFKALVEGSNGDAFDSLRTAMANLTMAKQLVFDAINQRKNEVDIYKYELESMRRAYTDNYYNAMDSLVQELDKSKNEAWLNTRYYKILSGLKIQTAPDFDEVYPIDGSYLFFFRIIPFQREALDDFMNGYYERLPKEEDNSVMIRKLNRCLAMFTVAKSLRQFDIIEFPSTIRSLFDESKASRNGKDEQNRVLQMSEQLLAEARNSLKDIDVILTNTEGGNVSTEESYMQPEDKFYSML